MWYIILNRVDNERLFRNALLKLLKCKSKELVLGYGYLGNEEDANKMVWLYDKKFIETLKSNPPKRITILGTKQSMSTNYIELAKYIDEKIPDIEVIVLIHKNLRYHKKFAVRFDDIKNPIISIIGSSNLTLSAYWCKSEDHNYNNELDIILWNKKLLNKNAPRLEEELIRELTLGKEMNNRLELFKELDRLGVSFDLELGLESVLEDVKYFAELDFQVEYMNKNYIDTIPLGEHPRYVESSATLDLKKKLLIAYCKEFEKNKYNTKIPLVMSRPSQVQLNFFSENDLKPKPKSEPKSKPKPKSSMNIIDLEKEIKNLNEKELVDYLVELKNKSNDFRYRYMLELLK